MKKQFLNAATVAALALAACGNNAGETATTDTTTTTSATDNTSTANTGTTAMASSTNSYAALADSVSTNSAQGYYLNPKTGKPYGKLSVDTATGAITTEAGEPVWHYVDKRNWWVYGDKDMNDTVTNWEQVGQAQMDKDKLMYKGENDKMVDYNAMYMKDDEAALKKWKSSDHGNKVKMVTDEGDKIKVKTDEEGNTKVKVNGDKVKLDSAGNVKKQ